jgi:hypothetical protein
MTDRVIFEFSTSSSPAGDTGPNVDGAIVQVRWNPTTVDTGADLVLSILPREGDTGDGFVILNDNDCLGADFVRAPRQAVHDSAGAALASGDSPYVLAGDRIRAKVIPGGAACAGRLYVWLVK